MSTIQSVGWFKIHPSKLDDFKRVTAKCMEVAREKDTTTLRDQQFFNEVETEWVVHEEYVDSEARMQHCKNMGDTAEKICDSRDHMRDRRPSQHGFARCGRKQGGKTLGSVLKRVNVTRRVAFGT